MSREFKTIFFYRPDDDLLLTFVASRSDWRGSFCFFLGLIIPQQIWGASSAMSPNDAVDGSFTGARAPWKWALLRPPRFGGAEHADDHNNRSRYREVGLSGSRRDADGQVVVRRQLKA
jgi:hypothetical protein